MRIDRAARARALMEFEASYHCMACVQALMKWAAGRWPGVLAACVMMPEGRCFNGWMIQNYRDA